MNRANSASGLRRVGMRAARSVSAALLDRAGPDPYAELRRTLHALDNPDNVGTAYEDLVAKGGRFVPAQGRLLCRRHPAHAGAKDAGLIVPEMADKHRGGGTVARYTILAVGKPCDPEHEDEHFGTCSGACLLPLGTVVAASAHSGADLRAWGGPELFVQRCPRIFGTVDA